MNFLPNGKSHPQVNSQNSNSVLGLINKGYHLFRQNYQIITREILTREILTRMWGPTNQSNEQDKE